MRKYSKEWCGISLLNCKICLNSEFDPRSIDIFMAGIKLREGIGITILGITIGIMWSYEKKEVDKVIWVR